VAAWGLDVPHDPFACIIAALMPLAPGKTLRPYDIIPREVDRIGAVENRVKAS
jgi:hypothetical protein